MGLGIIEDTKLDPVPGTATLEDLEGRRHVHAAGHSLKCSKEGIILEPQPSDDPDDPLNWPLWQRDLATLSLCLMSVLASTLSPLLAANTVTLITWFHGLTVTQAALLTGYHLMGVGISGPIFVAMARIWGKRHLFVLAPLVIIASSIWGACAGRNYNSLVAARVFQGFGLAPFEGLVNAAVGEMYFVHESGKRLALTNMCLFGGAFFTPVIVGRITQVINWQWTFWLIAIFTSAIAPLVFLFYSETTYNRKDAFNHSTTHLVGNDLGTKEVVASSSRDVRPSVSSPSIISKNETSVNEVERQWTSGSFDDIQDKPENNIHVARARKLITRRNLRLFSGRKSPDSFWQVFLRPFPLFFHPGILWACLTQGSMIAWTALLGVCLAVIMLGLNFNEAETGYMYTGAFVGALVAFAVTAVISDPVARFLTRRNHGVFEPEFRLVLIIPLALVGVSGLFGFGYTAGHIKHFSWLPPDVFFGFVVAGLVLGAIVAAQYVVDAHRDIAVEGFTCQLIFKNLITFALTFKGLDWLLEGGTQKLFFTFGYTQIAICALAIPMYILGKKNRSFFARHDILRMLRLR